MKIVDPLFFGELSDKYTNAEFGSKITPKVFYADGKEEVESELRDLSLVNLQYAKGMPKERSYDFDFVYEESVRVIRNYGVPKENFLTTLQKLYDEKLFRLSFSGETREQFSQPFYFATTEQAGGSLGQGALGSFVVYVYGKISFEINGNWKFEGLKSIYDFWNYEQHQGESWEETIRNTATYATGAVLEVLNSLRNLGRDSSPTESFIVTLRYPKVHYEEGFLVTAHSSQVDDIEIIDTSRSSFIRSAQYDPKENKAILNLNGKTYIYEIPKELWGKFKQAKSFGKFFDTYIKPFYETV